MSFFGFAAFFLQHGDILKTGVEVDTSLEMGHEGESYSRKKGGAIPWAHLLQARGSSMKQGRPCPLLTAPGYPSALVSSLPNLLSGKIRSHFSAILD